jgi:hypothetical protein
VPLSEAWQRVIASRSGDKRQPSPPGAAGGNGNGNAGAGSGATQPIDPASVASSVSSGGTRIRGSFGNADNSGKSQFEIALSSAENGNGGAPRAPSQGGYYRVHSGTPHAPATGATDGASAGGGAFSAGFALIAALFPDATPAQGPTQAQPPSERGQRMDIATGAAAAGGGRGTTLRGGYASLQPEEMDGSVLNWGAPFPQQQQPAAHAPQQYTSAQAHHWGPPTKVPSHAQSQQQHTQGTQGTPYHQQRQSHHHQRSQPSQAAPLAQNFAQAFSALNTLTTQLSSSVFGPPPNSSANNASGVQQSQTAGYNASMMSVPLEESFSV